MTADAAGAITIDSTVTSANISTSAAGAVDLDETDGITLTDIDTTDGSITVDAGGLITATDVVAAGGSGDSVTFEHHYRRSSGNPGNWSRCGIDYSKCRRYYCGSNHGNSWHPSKTQQPDRSMMPQMIIPQT